MNTQIIKSYGIDNDDVLFPTIPNLCCKFHNLLYGTKTQMEDFNTFDIVGLWGITEEDWWNREREFYKSHFYHTMKPIEGALELVEFLSKRGLNHLITGRGKDVEHHTILKLEQHFKPHHFQGIHHSGPKIWNGARETKSEICKRLGITTMFDDFDSTLINCAENNINGILFTQPWNKDVTDLPKIIHRARNGEEAIEIVEKFDL